MIEGQTVCAGQHGCDHGLGICGLLAAPHGPLCDEGDEQSPGRCVCAKLGPHHHVHADGIACGNPFCASDDTQPSRIAPVSHHASERAS